MITHNMRDAIDHGNRLIMMHEGKIIIDVSGEEKKNLTIEALLNMFEVASGSEFASDKGILSKKQKNNYKDRSAPERSFIVSKKQKLIACQAFMGYN